MTKAPGADELRDLYLGTYGFVHAKARAILRNEADAVEVAHDVYLKAHASWDKLAAHPSRVGWLLMTCTHVAIDRLRHARIERKDALRWIPPEPASPAEAIEAGVLVEALLAEESELTRAIVCAVGLDGMTQEECAEQLGVARKTVQRHLEGFKARSLERVPSAAVRR